MKKIIPILTISALLIAVFSIGRLYELPTKTENKTISGATLKKFINKRSNIQINEVDTYNLLDKASKTVIRGQYTKFEDEKLEVYKNSWMTTSTMLYIENNKAYMPLSPNEEQGLSIEDKTIKKRIADDYMNSYNPLKALEGKKFTITENLLHYKGSCTKITKCLNEEIKIKLDKLKRVESIERKEYLKDSINEFKSWINYNPNIAIYKIEGLEN